MSQENVEVGRAAVEALNRGDVEGLVELWDPECEYHPALEGAVEGPKGAYIGHDGIREWWGRFHDEWGDPRA
ncbi:MAG TPA: nuclear transport factor 2 family protein, partial [Thermoleophilaceae bacterium]|nr:nuclear transport factor 2 family protein [Thermoleophilaceae bacterium]